MLICKVLQLRRSAIKHSERRELCSRADLSLWLTAVLYVRSLLGTKASDLNTNGKRKPLGRSGYWAGRIMYLSLVSKHSEEKRTLHGAYSLVTKI